jgi:hypothetical protein
MKTSISIALCIAALFLNISAVSAAEQAKGAAQSATKATLTYANVVSFFKSARFRAIEVQKRCTIFFEGEWKNANVYDYCVVMVENSDQDIQVTFYLTDAHEMNWVTEFLDGPFFAPDETEKLFGLINANREVRAKQVGRFRVDFHHWQPRHAEIIVFSFTPLRKSST